MQLKIWIAGLLAGTAVVLPAAAQQQPQSSDIGNINVQGETAPGAGYMIQEDSPKQRSTVTQQAIEREPASANVFQLMSRLPGVNAQSNDATGLFGGQMSMRGFNSDEIGFTIAGVPVNDSGNYAVFPQEYVDPENLQEIDVAQGAPDIDQPQGGDVGGAVSILIREPTDAMRAKVVQSLGELGYFKSFGRFDTGRLFGLNLKAFISYSKAEVDKWKGPGGADRDHIDAGIVYETSGGSKFTFTSVFNTAINYSFRSPTMAQFQSFGRYFDNEPGFPGFPAAKNGTAQNYGAPVSGFPSAYPVNSLNPGYQFTNYYKYRVNPFTNEIASFNADMKLLETLRLSVTPYYWNGYGNGGGFATIKESGGNGGNLPNGVDLNGDGDKLDTVGFYRPSITSTQRPGVNTKLTWQPVEWETARIGLNFDHSRHHQTQPFEFINPDGSVNVWANGGNLLTFATGPQAGTLVQGRNQLTFNDTKVAYFENTLSLFNDRLKILAGIKRQEVNRDGHNGLPAALATGSASVITPSLTYLNYLPEFQASYRVTSQDQVFVNLQKNARAPSNFTLYESVFSTIGDQAPETAWSLDVGYRRQTEDVLASISFFGTNFQNRQLQFPVGNDPNTLTDLNAGAVHDRGVEFEIGTAKPVYDFNLYGSAAYTKSIIQSNLQTGNGIVPTAGETYPNTPKWLLNAVVDYEPKYLPGTFFSLSGKYTSARYATLVNDEKAPGYPIFDFAAGYRFPDGMLSFLHNARFQFNIQNLFDRDYLFFGYGNSSNTIAAKTYLANGKAISGTGIAPTYTVGAPRFFGVKFSAEF